MLLAPCLKQSQSIYRSRRPEKTVLFRVIKKHYRTWKNNLKRLLPRYVEKTFEKYLKCGNPAKGFAWAYCNCCHTDFLIAFSCKCRGICPSCNTLIMVKTAAHLIEHVIPAIPIRQWVISFPLRIRHYLLEPSILQDVLEIVMNEIRKAVIADSPDAPNPQIGAVSFLQNFGSTLNVHPHFHLIVSDGFFSTENNQSELQFQEVFLNEGDIRTTQEHIRMRVLKFFEKRGRFNQEEVKTMLAYENSGFSLDASVKICSWDHDGLERLIRYCARPCFASENLRLNGSWIIYRLSKPTHKGQRFVQLDPLEFLDRIAAFIPLPHRHRRHYHGVFAPNSPLRKMVIAYAKRGLAAPTSIHQTVEKTRCASLDWAQLIKRIYEVDPLLCSKCGKAIKIIGFITHQAEIYRILRGIGWSIKLHDFDPAYDLYNNNWEFCQLIPGSADGFPIMEEQEGYCNGSDPPFLESHSDPPHFENDCDSPHLEYEGDPPQWEE